MRGGTLARARHLADIAELIRSRHTVDVALEVSMKGALTVTVAIVVSSAAVALPAFVPRGRDYFLFPSPAKVGKRIFSLNRLSSSIVQYHSPISTRGRDEYRIGLPTHGFV